MKRLFNRLDILKSSSAILLSMLSGFLLSFSWPEIGVFPFIFISFIPLFILEHKMSKSKRRTSLKLLFFSFCTFLIFNILTTYWIQHASTGGAITAFVINALLMALVFMLFHKVKKVLGKRKGYLFFIVFWISMEYLHLHWEIAWPWLSLGNVFAKSPDLVQWYEYTGILGGSLWILIVNVLLFNWGYNTHRRYKDLFIPIICLFIPIAVSLYTETKHESGEMTEVVIVQPNIDSYNENLFDIDHFISISKDQLTDSTELLLAPETVLQGYLDQDSLNYRFYLIKDSLYLFYQGDIDKLKCLQDSFPNLNILLGATVATGSYNQEYKYIEKYNSAIFIDTDQRIFIHHKTKLVPGAEGIPYPSIFNKFRDLFSIELAGVAGNYLKGEDIAMFNAGRTKILPLICYESVFGDIVTNKNPNIIAIITNDGWWKNTAGYRQHFDYARLRAIEQRKSIVRSANTGISGLIYPDGSVIRSTKWDEEISFRVSVPTNTIITFYNRFGDYIGRISSFLSILLIFNAFVKNRIKKMPIS